MLADPKPEVASLRKVLLPQFILLDFQTALEDFFSFGAADSDMDGDLFVTTDSKCADGVAGFAY